MNTHKKRIQKIITIGFLVCVPSIIAVHSVAATAVRSVFSDQAQGTTGDAVKVDVAPGVGLNISFIATGEVVKKAWIDDPSRITLSFDGNLCQAIAQGQECSSESGATVVHLRQIRPINFPDLLSSQSGGTLLTLITEGTEGRKLYQFRVRPVSKEPGYTTLAVRPMSDKSQAEVIPQPSPPTSLAQAPLLPQPVQSAEPSNSSVKPNPSLPSDLVAEQPAPESINSLPAQPLEQAPNSQSLREQRQDDSITASISNQAESQFSGIAVLPASEKLIYPAPQISQSEALSRKRTIPDSSRSKIAMVNSKAQSNSVSEWSQQLSSSDYLRQLQR
ncbi:hypothetical protein ACQ4M3_05530 [Leptolyngbya sp. AN03gr2]|uniref:hypothetical protein n=1 Tax=unclassified Leptolyngbya TaxID=2650499 RepID=UPI003D31E0B4